MTDPPEHFCCEHAGFHQWRDRDQIRRQFAERYVTRAVVIEYLDRAIRCWRVSRDEATADEDRSRAECYVDAFQSARVSLLGELLPEDAENIA